MYHSYFGLDDQAFSIAVNPRYLYMSSQHREALAHVLYGVNSGGFVMLSGEVGTGKTTIIRCLLEQLPENADLAVILNPAATARDLMCSICEAFRVPYERNETSLKVLMDKLSDFLVANHRRGRRSIVLIDEAQLLKVSTLEQVRLLTNLETNTQKLLQIILVGQPELNDLLAKPALRQLSQRITARYHLRPLNEKEVAAYIKHRLKVAGMPAGRQPFPVSIIRKIYVTSRGIPRVINVLCDRMLLGAYSREATLVDQSIFRQATVEVLGRPQEPLRRWFNKNWIFVGAGVAGTLLLSGLFWLLLGGQSVADRDTQMVGEGQIIRDVQAEITSTRDAARVSRADYWFRDQSLAVRELLQLSEIPSEGMDPCWSVSEAGLACENQKVATWDEFQKIDRPAVLTITTPSRHTGYVVLAAIRGGDGWVRNNGQLQRVSLEQLGKLWNGEFVFVWRRPPGFGEAIGLGASGPLVAWVAGQFAQLDGQQAPLARERFNTPLQKRVKLFQQTENLQDDGLVGLQTLLRLNEALGLELSMSDMELTMLGTAQGAGG